MHELALSFLVAVLNLVGGNSLPRDILHDWNVTRAWEPVGGHYVLEAESNSLIAKCARDPSKHVLFPQVIHGVHEIFIDGHLRVKTGDPSFRVASPFYHQASIFCGDIENAKTMSWKVTSYSLFFSRIRSAPLLVESTATATFFDVSANLMAGGSLIVIAIFASMIYFGRVSNSLTYSLSLGSLALSLYFLNAVNSWVGIDLSMILSHKIADIGLWVGGILFLNAFRIDGILSKSFFVFFVVSAVVGSIIILFGSSGDEVQFGTMIPMGPCMLACLNSVYNLRSIATERHFFRGNILKFVSITLFSVFGINDILHVIGVYDGSILLSVGIVGAVLGLSVAVNQEIENTYEERDTLLHNLEDKVQEKTRDLQSTLQSLQSTQAELVQSAKLASLGTLSAGVAHEINNSINYVSGALVPLERKVMSTASEQDKVILGKLFAAIKEGTSLTVEIVRSLRTYTGLNQATAKDVSIFEVTKSVLTILKSKLKEVEISLEIEDGVYIFGNIVGLNQILMNLITNALDAMPVEGAKLKIKSFAKGDEVHLIVSVNGSGIPEHIRKKIFDPFFTTKEVGKGTGLGLHIVQKEVERHKGLISVSSDPGQGTSFSIIFPREAVSKVEAA